MATDTRSHPAAERDAQLRLPDGRTLSYATLGAGDGPWVVVLDGPGSRGLARAAAPVATALGIRLVAPDRPGFFASTSAPGSAIADWPVDHAALLDALGAERAGILGQSGGTPYALAAAAGAALRARTTGLAFVGAVAPLYDPVNVADVGKQVRTGLKLSRRAPWLLRAGLRATSRAAAKDPEKAARRVAKDLPPADAALVEQDPALWALHVRATSEILSRPEAIAREIGLLARPWGIDIDAVACPVSLWVGEHDTTHPPAHSHRLAQRLGGAPVQVVPGAAVFGMLPVYGDALRFAAGGAAS